MPFSKSDLVYKYSWEHTKEDDPKLKGTPDSSLLNRNEGYEVLYMIKALMKDWKFFDVADGKKIERMIRVHPSELRSQQHVKNWIQTNWKNH
jgi:hypothetical protein